MSREKKKIKKKKKKDVPSATPLEEESTLDTSTPSRVGQENGQPSSHVGVREESSCPRPRHRPGPDLRLPQTVQPVAGSVGTVAVDSVIVRGS